MMRAGQRHPRRARDRDNLRRQAACEDGTRFQGGGLATLGVEPVGDRVATSPSKVLRTSRMYFAASRVGTHSRGAAGPSPLERRRKAGSPSRLIPWTRLLFEKWLVREDAPVRHVISDDETIAFQLVQRPEHLGRLCPHELG
jgi:hypothetical protein